jgi:hypothetical protein
MANLTPKLIVLPDQKKVIATLKTSAGKFRATATCGPNDNWDEERGKALAAARVELKHAIKQTKILNKAYKDILTRMQIEDNRIIKRLDRIATKNNAYMDKYLELKETIEQLST